MKAIEFMKKIAFLSVLSAVFFSVTAEEVTITEPKTQIPLSRKIEIDSTQDYTFTINAKGGKGKLTIRFYQFDNAQRRMGHAHANGKADTLTELAALAIAGTKEFIVKEHIMMGICFI